MQTALLAIGALVIFFVFMGVRLLLIKNGEFKGTCASQSPFLRNSVGTCNYCGKDVGSCENEDNDDMTEVDKVLAKA